MSCCAPAPTRSRQGKFLRDVRPVAIELDDVVRRTTQPVRNIKPTGHGRSPQFLAQMSHITWRRNVATHLSDHNGSSVDVLRRLMRDTRPPGDLRSHLSQAGLDPELDGPTTRFAQPF